MTKKTWIVLSLILAVALAAVAQEKPADSGWSADDPPVWMLQGKPPLLFQAETAEQRKQRIGLDEDPGLDPDPLRVWERNGTRWHIEKYPRRTAIYQGVRKGYVRPNRSVSAKLEIYREDPESVWVWIEVLPAAPPPPPPAAKPEVEPADQEAEADGPMDDSMNARRITVNEEAKTFLTALRTEFREVTPRPSGITLQFRESSEGLPTRGSWRNGLDVADMDADGRLDIILPPQRGGNGFPVIFRATPEGRWDPWRETQWDAGFNYGTVAVGDLNGDGHADIVAGAHLMKIFALLGDGKGKFSLSNEGLPERFPTRRIALGDADADGDLDIFAISEGPTIGGEVGDVSYLRLYLNEEKATRWREVKVAERGRQVGGDWMTVNDFDGDGRVDVAGSSIYFGGPDVIYLQGKGGTWRPFGRGWLPFFSYYNAMTSGPATSKKKDDLFLAYRRVWPTVAKEDFEPPPITDVTGIERVSWNGKKGPTRETVVSWSSGKPVWALTHGDFNGDGRVDLAYALTSPVRIAFLLGDGKGGFRSAEAEGLQVPDRNLYDLKARDLNLDGRDDLLLMFEKGATGSDGSVRVWLAGGAKK
ncbi:MAG TPA: FG-GAP-like repeat-containing protein [Thermoanaerobaculia bacterium]|nr:FG-GAP-like repeat-containing protein [Thermoanaerobaculia bacterium]